VDLRLDFRGALAVLAMVVALAGCGSSDIDTGAAWFSKPMDFFGRKGGYTYAQLNDAKTERPITPNDLVDANGVCSIAAPPAQAPSPAGDPGASPAGTADAASQLGGGVGIGMSECDVISRVGPPTAVNLSRNPHGDRTAILTFKAGPRPGVYRFVGGRLTEMDRVDEPPPPAEPAKKKKPAKNNKPAKTNDAT
jgi:hypothetical protein